MGCFVFGSDKTSMQEEVNSQEGDLRRLARERKSLAQEDEGDESDGCKTGLGRASRLQFSHRLQAEADRGRHLETRGQRNSGESEPGRRVFIALLLYLAYLLVN